MFNPYHCQRKVSETGKRKERKKGRKGRREEEGREEFLLAFMLNFLFQLLYYYRITFLSKLQFSGQSHQSQSVFSVFTSIVMHMVTLKIVLVNS